MNWFNHLLAEWRFLLIEKFRYFANTIGSVITLCLVFSLVFFGFRGLTGADPADTRLDYVVAGYILWLTALLGYQSITDEIQDAMNKGTLEQMYLSPGGLPRLLIFRLSFNILDSLLLMAVVFYITMLISGQWLEFSYTRVLLVLLLGIPALAGIGLIFSGFILLNKRFGSFLQIFTFALAAVIALPAPPADFDNVYSYLPFASAAYAAREIMTGTITSDIPGSWYLYIGGVSAIYLLIGFIVFSLLENRAKSLALLGQY